MTTKSTPPSILAKLIFAINFTAVATSEMLNDMRGTWVFPNLGLFVRVNVLGASPSKTARSKIFTAIFGDTEKTANIQILGVGKLSRQTIKASTITSGPMTGKNNGADIRALSDPRNGTSIVEVTNLEDLFSVDTGMVVRVSTDPHADEALISDCFVAMTPSVIANWEKALDANQSNGVCFGMEMPYASELASSATAESRHPANF